MLSAQSDWIHEVCYVVNYRTPGQRETGQAYRRRPGSHGAISERGDGRNRECGYQASDVAG